MCKRDQTRLEDIREDIPSTILDLMKACWNQQEHERPVFGTIRGILFNQLSSNQIELDVPQMRKISSMISMRATHLSVTDSDCDEPDGFPASFGVEILEHSRAKGKFITGFRRVINSLLEYLDPFNGLLRSWRKKRFWPTPSMNSWWTVARMKLTRWSPWIKNYYLNTFCQKSSFVVCSL